jgi:hypothetical protein
MTKIAIEKEESIRELTRGLCDIINLNPLSLEDKLAAIMLASFEILSIITANGIRMNMSDGRMLCLDLIQQTTTTH